MRRNAILGWILGLLGGVVLGYWMPLLPKTAEEKNESSEKVMVSQERPGGEETQETPPADLPKFSPSDLREAFMVFDATPQMWVAFPSARAISNLEDRILASDPASMARSLSETETDSFSDVFYLMMGAYARKDPKGAWAQALEIKNPGPRGHAQRAVISSLAAVDPKQAFAMIESLGTETSKRMLRHVALIAAAWKEPTLAWHYYQQIESELQDEGVLQSAIFANWAEQDAASAKAAAARLTAGAFTSAQKGILSSMMLDDPEGAWRQALALPSGSQQDEILSQIAAFWAKYDPTAAIRAAGRLSGDGVRKMAVQQSIAVLAGSDLDAALKYIVETPESSMQVALIDKLNENYFLDRRKVISTILKSLPKLHSSEVLNSLLGSMTENEPAEAAALFEEFPPALAASGAAKHIAENWAYASAGTEELMKWLEKLPQGKVRDEAYAAAFNAWCWSSFDEAAGALERLDAGARKVATEALLARAGTVEPARALAWISTLPDAAQRAKGEKAVLSSWASYDPREASAHWQTLPADLRDQTLGNLIHGWAELDVEAAAGWLKNLEPSLGRDTALMRVSDRIAREDAATAIQWAMLISDEKARADRVEQLYLEWKSWEPERCRTWLKNSGLPAQLQHRLLK